MKTNFIFILIVAFVSQQLIAQDIISPEFNGWGYLEWNTPKNSVENQLLEHGIAIQDDFSDPAYVNITRCDQDDMDTWLYYNSSEKLTYIEQTKEFSINQIEEANAFYEKLKKSLKEKYGEPDIETNDKSEKVINIVWNLEFTEVHLRYDYKYKIIDEFGCCSYSVKVFASSYEQSKSLEFAIIPFNTASDWLFKNCSPAKLTSRDIIKIDEILVQAINTHNLVLQTSGDEYIDLKNYKRQYVAVNNKSGQKEVWVNCFCNHNLDDWRDEIIFVKDGGNCFFNVKINLDTENYYDLQFNGKG